MTHASKLVSLVQFSTGQALIQLRLTYTQIYGLMLLWNPRTCYSFMIISIGNLRIPLAITQFPRNDNAVYFFINFDLHR